MLEFLAKQGGAYCNLRTILYRMQLIADNVDFDASPVIRGERSLEEMGPELYDEILAVASGKLTKSEIHGHFEA